MKHSQEFDQFVHNFGINSVANFIYRYNGIRKNLQMIFGNANSNMQINLCFNMDGLPLFNSSKYQFWPILASVQGKYSSQFKNVRID